MRGPRPFRIPLAGLWLWLWLAAGVCRLGDGDWSRPPLAGGRQSQCQAQKRAPSTVDACGAGEAVMRRACVRADRVVRVTISACRLGCWAKEGASVAVYRRCNTTSTLQALMLCSVPAVNGVTHQASLYRLRG